MTHVHSSNTFLTPAPDVVARQLPDGAVLVHLGTNAIFELNPTGSRIWALLADGRTSAGIVDALCAEYDVDPAAAARDVDDLIVRLTAAGLVQA